MVGQFMDVKEQIKMADFTLELEGFRGPLGLLLDLIEREKLRVNDVSLAKVSDDYIEYIQDRSEIPLSQTSQFIVVASTLLLIKSRSLLPTLELSEEEDEDIRDLEKRLKLYREVRRATKLIRNRWGKKFFLPTFRPIEIKFSPGSDITKENLHLSLKNALDALPSFDKAPTAKVSKEISLEEMIENLTERIRSAASSSFNKITEKASKIEGIVNFLALLELVKRGTLSVTQDEHFSDIDFDNEEVDTPHYG
ncbi:hypothetical protein COB52_01825 [Candidatus Kaiserbacteria bacterium]|nr:MAG: hypothetical protein COB52_01825 [Candidatus Kaiserbacteria bacterium]